MLVPIFSIAGKTVACETDAGNDECPRDGLNGHAGDIGSLKRRMSGQGIGVAHHDARHHDKDGHEDSPEEAHDRLLVPDPDVAVGDHV